MAEEARHRNGAVSKIVLDYAIKNANTLMHVDTITSDTGLSAAQVRTAIRKMEESGTTGTWEVALRGAAWVFKPIQPERGGDWILVERLLQLGSGDDIKVLVRAEDDSVWTMTPTKL